MAAPPTPRALLIGDAPPTIYLLADHLDAALAAGEDLLALRVAVDDPTKSDGATPVWAELRQLVARTCELEVALLARLLQARRRARDLGQYDDEIKPVLALFASGTATLVDAAAELADSTDADFDAGIDALAYLRSRGVIAADAGSVLGADGSAKIGSGMVSIGEDFLVARRLPLGALLDLAARLLDVLDTNYGLFPEEDDTSAARVEAEPVPPPPTQSVNHG